MQREFLKVLEKAIQDTSTTHQNEENLKINIITEVQKQTIKIIKNIVLTQRETLT